MLLHPTLILTNPLIEEVYVVISRKKIRLIPRGKDSAGVLQHYPEIVIPSDLANQAIDSLEAMGFVAVSGHYNRHLPVRSMRFERITSPRFGGSNIRQDF